MHKAAIVRTVTHAAGCHNTLPSYTGHEIQVADNRITLDSYPPSMGSVCEYLRQSGEVGGVEEGAKRRSRELPDYVYMPCYLGWGQNIRRAGPYGGFLGKQFDALTTECNPHRPEGTREPVPSKPQQVLGMPRIMGTLQVSLSIDSFLAADCSTNSTTNFDISKRATVLRTSGIKSKWRLTS